MSRISKAIETERILEVAEEWEEETVTANRFHFKVMAIFWN